MEFWGVEVKPENTLKVTPGEDNLIHISQGTLVSTEKIRESVILTVTVDKTNLVIGILSQDKFPQISFNLVFEKEFELSHNCSKGSVHFIGYKSPNIHQYSAVAVTDSGSVEPAATTVVNSDPKPDVKLKMSKVIGEALGVGEGTVCIKSGSEEKKLKLSDTLIEAFRDVKCSSEEAKRHLSDALIEALRKSTGCIKNGSEEEQLSDTLTEALGNIKCGSEENELKLSDTLIEALRNIKCGSEEEKLKLSDTLIETLWKSNIRFDIEYEKKKISDFLAERGCKEFKPSPRLSKAVTEAATRIARKCEENKRRPLTEEVMEDRIEALSKAVKKGYIIPI